MVKGKPIIGILATSNYLLTNDTFQDTYRYGNNYAKKIVECGGIPYFIPLVDENIVPDTLEVCDGLLLPGGNRVRPVCFEIIDYFYNSNKPILGICLGMQTLAMYSTRSEDRRVLKLIDNGVDHHPVELVRDNNDTVVHKDYVKKDSKLFDIIKDEEIMVNSVHKSTITDVGKNFRVSITSEDGLIEGLEYIGDDKFIIGVQFHPEILPQFNNIFDVFINKCKKDTK